MTNSFSLGRPFSLPGWLRSFFSSPATVLPFLALLIMAARLHTYHEAMNRDLGDYATIAHEMRFGKALYFDLPDQKPPAIHLTYYLAESIAGYGPLQIYTMTVAASAMTLLCAYLAGAAFTGERSAGLWAAAFWTIVSGDPLLEANQPNAEVFMNAFVMAGIACMAAAYQRKTGWDRAVAAGLFFAWATLYKQVIVTVPAMLCLGQLLLPPHSKTRWRALGEGLTIGAIIAAAWGAAIGYFAWRGHLEAFIHWVVNYNRQYAGNLSVNIWQSMFALPRCMVCTVPLILLALIGIGLQFLRGHRSMAVFFIALAVGTQIAIALPGRGSPHYFQLWFPWLITGAGCAMPLLQAALKSSKAFLLAGVSVTATLLALELPYYFLPAAEWSNLKYSTIFLETNVIARQIKRLLLPGETFFQLADEAELYALSGQRPHSRYLGIASFTYAQEGVATRKQAAQELAAAKPDLIVADAISMLLLQKVKDSDILPYLEAHYAPVQKEYLRYLFFVKKGSPLEKRWASGAANFMKSADGSDPDPFVEPSN